MPVLLSNRVIDEHFEKSFHAGVPKAVLRRAEFLPEPDRTLFRMVVRGGVSRREIARVMNMQPGTMSRRLHRLSRRLYDPLVIALIESRCPLAEHHRRVGIARFLQGMNIGRIAREHNITRGQVLRSLSYVRGWYAALQARLAKVTHPHVRPSNEAERFFSDESFSQSGYSS
jgi:DNA-directed RNA polymerase specialized sigma24 family protein